MLVRYQGPPDTVNHDVGLALAAQREDVEIELPNQLDGVEGDTVRATDTTEASALLEPGHVYDLPHELALHLLDSSPWWHRVTDFDKLTKAQLLEVAAEREIEGRSTMTKEQLVEALRAAPAPELEPAATTEDQGVGSTAASSAAAGGIGAGSTGTAAPTTAGGSE